MSFGIWCGGGLGKQRTTQPQTWKQRARQELFLLRNRSTPAICVAVVEVQREGSRGEGVSFCLRAGFTNLIFSYGNFLSVGIKHWLPTPDQMFSLLCIRL